MCVLLADIKRVTEDRGRPLRSSKEIRNQVKHLPICSALWHSSVFSLHKEAARFGVCPEASWIKVPQSHVLRLSLECGWIGEREGASEPSSAAEKQKARGVRLSITVI